QRSRVLAVASGGAGQLFEAAVMLTAGLGADERDGCILRREGKFAAGGERTGNQTQKGEDSDEKTNHALLLEWGWSRRAAAPLTDRRCGGRGHSRGFYARGMNTRLAKITRPAAISSARRRARACAAAARGPDLPQEAEHAAVAWARCAPGRRGPPRT